VKDTRTPDGRSSIYLGGDGRWHGRLAVDGDRPVACRIALSTLDGGVAAVALAGGDPARAAPARSNAAIIAAGTLR
jgi:hypothetical protein